LSRLLIDGSSMKLIRKRPHPNTPLDRVEE
jgi:hypothetical protein